MSAGAPLNAAALAAREEFTRRYGPDGRCLCFSLPPCSSCQHPGNPKNQTDADTVVVAHHEEQAHG